MFKGLFDSDTAVKHAQASTSQGARRRYSSNVNRSLHGRAPSYPPFPLPLPHRNINVTADAAGLILSPANGGGRAVLLSWALKTTVSVIDSLSHIEKKASVSHRCSAFGVVGVLNLFQESYVLLISSRRHVGYFGSSETKSIKCLTGILAVPLSDRAKAAAVLRDHSAKHADQQRRQKPQSSGLSDISGVSSDASDEEENARKTLASTAVSGINAVPNPPVEASPNDAEAVETSIQSSTDANRRPGLLQGLGRIFWSTSTAEKDTKPLDLIALAEQATPPVSAATEVHASGPEVVQSPLSPANSTETPSLRELDKKILTEAIAEMTSGGFFYSQNFDFTRCTQRRWAQLREEKQFLNTSISDIGVLPAVESTSPSRTSKAALPQGEDAIDINNEEPQANRTLVQRADRRFWWNNWLSKPLTDVGLDEYVTVLVQGFAQSRSVTVGDELDVNMLVISRRSIERPGYRYQRRGVNDNGGVANFVETEFVLTSEVDEQLHLSSYVQIRGSIPLFWSQSPWSLKPVPVLERSSADNEGAIRKHFSKQQALYFGKVNVINLAETTGKEGVIVNAYKKAVTDLDDDNIQYKEWDFHHICKGMKFEKISILLDEIAEDILHVKSFWSLNGKNLELQAGVFRTNCMDCLDRTNVVQSAIARNILSSFLVQIGIGPLQSASKEKLDLAFNAIWANNGDAISREYAGTSALKGDFVRSGKRNWRGQINDATNSMARLYQNTILDFFKQSMLDYVLGININAFADFSTNMQTADPGEILRLNAIRRAAINTAWSHCLSEDEQKEGAWTVLSPATLGKIQDSQFEEKILLITKKALYCCSYEYTLQKVREFVRIPLGQILSLTKGAYILSALHAAARNVNENFGFTVKYLPEGSDARSSTYSVRNTSAILAPQTAAGEDAIKIQERVEAPRMIAFKAMRQDLVRDPEAQGLSELRTSSRQQVNTIVSQIRQLCEDIGSASEEDNDFIVDSPIISVEQAAQDIGLFDRIQHEIKSDLALTRLEAISMKRSGT